MPENTNVVDSPAADENQKMYTQAEMQKAIQSRIAKLAQERDEYKQAAEQAAQQQAAQQSIGQQPMQQQGMSQQPMQQPMGGGDPSQAMSGYAQGQPMQQDQGQPFGGADIKSILDDNNKKLMDQMAIQNTIRHADSEIAKMRRDDPEFHKLASEGHNIPEELAVKIATSLNHVHAKSLLKKILSDRNAYNDMRVSVQDNGYDNWIQKQMASSAPSEQDEGMKSAPDLGSESIKGDDSSGYESNLDNYLAGKS